MTSFTPHRQIDLTIDGADEVERGTLNLIKGLGGALLHEKIVASNSRRLAIIVDVAKLVDRLGMRTPVPVEVAGAAGVHRLESPRAHRGTPPILVVMGVSGAGKSTVAKELAARLGWPFEEGDWLHPEANVAKMHAGIGLTDADRRPWLEAVAAWIDGQRAKGRPGIMTCSALKRSYRNMIIGDRAEVRLVYLRGSRTLIAERLAGRHGHFMPASLLQSHIDTLEEPGPDEDPLIIDIGPPAGQLADEIIRLLGASVAIV